MHENDFELLDRRELENGIVEFAVRVKAANLTRTYSYHPSEDRFYLTGDPLLVSGHDMTSIIGKRVREWLRSQHL